MSSLKYFHFLPSMHLGRLQPKVTTSLSDQPQQSCLTKDCRLINIVEDNNLSDILKATLKPFHAKIKMHSHG